MNTTHFKWLVKREFWENKGGLFWAPVVISALMTVFLMIGIGGAIYAAGDGAKLFIDGEEAVRFSQITAHISDEERAHVAAGITGTSFGVSVPLLMVMTFVVFFYCLGSLYDDRRDRSILFWKSLPVSDATTVWSKVFSALVTAPLISLIFAIALYYAFSFILMTVAAAYKFNVFGIVLSTSTFYTAGLGLLSLLPLYALWALPTVGWLMMVSAWAKRVPFVWAVGVPVVGAAMISAVAGVLNLDFNHEVLWAYIGRLLLSIVPGTWFGALAWEGRAPNDGFETPAELVSDSYAVFASPQLWIGAVAGIAMIFAAIKLRKHRDEG